jgi:hypothetical protein
VTAKSTWKKSSFSKESEKKREWCYMVLGAGDRQGPYITKHKGEHGRILRRAES